MKSKKYKGVYHYKNSRNKVFWLAQGSIRGINFNIHTTSERDAALKYDKKMIENGKPPVNILKPK